MKKFLNVIVSVICFFVVTEVKAQYGIVVYGLDKDTLCFIPDNLVGIRHGEPVSNEMTLLCPDTVFVRDILSVDSIGFVPVPERIVLSENIGDWSEIRLCKDGTAVMTKLENVDKPIEMVMVCPDDSLGTIVSDIRFDEEARPVEMLMNSQKLMLDWLDGETFNLTVIFSDSISCKYDSLRYVDGRAEHAKPIRFVPDMDKKPWLTRLGGVVEMVGGAVSSVVGAVMVVGSGAAELASAGSSTPVSLPGIGFGLMAVSSGTESMANGFINAFTNDYATGWDHVGNSLFNQAAEKGIENGVLPNVPNEYFSYMVDSKYNPTKTGWAGFLATLLGQILGNIQHPYTWFDLVKDVQRGVMTGIAKDVTHNKATLRGYIWPYILESPSEKFRTEYGIIVYPSANSSERLVKKEANGSGGVIEYIFDGLKPNTSYTYLTYYWDKTNSVSALAETKSFKTKPVIPVITDFKQTGSQYKENGFSHNGRTYDYKYDVAVTVELTDAKGVVDWGYVYLDPNGQESHISLKNFGSPYTDTRYVYYRNESSSTVTLYGYVKYEGDNEYYYGEPVDYPVQHSMTYCPDDQHPHMIDLGLPSGTKWACCNVGASTPEGYGGYYAWGEVNEKDVYNQVTYQYSTGEDRDENGYYDDYHPDTDVYGVWQNLGSDIAGTGYDVAHVKWGGSWVMPSYDQIKELVINCSYTWMTLNGVKGGQFTGPNGGTIFLPAAGYRWFDNLDVAGSNGYYWSSTQNPSSSYNAYNLYFYSGHADWYGNGHRYDGPTVRPVSR